MRRTAWAVGGSNMPGGAGAGAASPKPRTSQRHPDRAWSWVTFCSRTTVSSWSTIRPVAGRRSPGFARRARATACGRAAAPTVPVAPEPPAERGARSASKADQSSSSPSSRCASATAAVAPGPHASTGTGPGTSAEGAGRTSTVTGSPEAGTR
ncbi:hypothetical protein ACFFX0_11685 [Citricoccus parietis]|uniref:Uncharacterized protein n=1 Tax=Citricoccus parietis TaxID=592307 RepID=A0ABV5FYQ9_9MICC